MIDPSRRSFLIGGAAALITAPAIVRATSIMPVKVPTKVIRIMTLHRGQPIYWKWENWIPGTAEVPFDQHVFHGDIIFGKNRNEIVGIAYGNIQ